MQITHVCRIGWPHTGGMERVVADLAVTSRRRGHDVRVITLDRAVTDGSVLRAGVLDGVAFVRVPNFGPRRYPFARGLLDAVRGSDVLHVHGIDGLLDQLVLSRRWHGASIGVSTHGGFLHTGRHPRLKRLWMRTLTRRVLDRTDAVWFSSESDRDGFAAFGVRGSVLPDGVDVARFAAVRRRPVRGRWLVLGRVDVHKGIDDLIEALGCLGPGAGAVDVVGPDRVPGLRRDLERRARARGVAMRFLGERSDAEVLEALATAELALFPSRYEGFGLAVVEAMAAGVPVVVSAIRAHDALVTPGVDGWRVDFREPAAAAASLARIQQLDPAPIAQAARERAAEHGWDRRGLEYERAYRALLARRAA